MNILKYKKYYLYLTIAILLPLVLSLIVFGLNLSIDFTGGSVTKYTLDNTDQIQSILDIYSQNNIEVISSSNSSSNVLTISSQIVPVEVNKSIFDKVVELNSNISQNYFETIGPAVGGETTLNAFKSVFWASLAILLYIAYAFRNIPNEYSSINFGLSAIIAMLHDALFLFGVFSILGFFYDIKIDSLFITAVLTVIGFSVHDTIVVFDRLRENLNKLPKTWQFEKIANYSLVETLTRSLATSLTVLLTLLSLYILGGESIKNFVLALLIGITAGTYSSIFVATPTLVFLTSKKLFHNKDKK